MLFSGARLGLCTDHVPSNEWPAGPVLLIAATAASKWERWSSFASGAASFGTMATANHFAVGGSRCYDRIL